MIEARACVQVQVIRVSVDSVPKSKATRTSMTRMLVAAVHSRPPSTFKIWEGRSSTVTMTSTQVPSANLKAPLAASTQPTPLALRRKAY